MANNSQSKDFCRHCGLPVKRRESASQEFCCYGCVFAFQVVQGADGETRPVSWILVKLGISTFLAMNVMAFSLALHSSSIYPDYFFHISETGKAFDELMRYFLLFLSLPVFFLLGVPLLENIIRESREGRWSIDGLIGIGVAASFAYSLYSTFTGNGPLYYDVAVMVLTFLTLGRYLESRFRLKTTQALKKLVELDKKPAALLLGNREIEVNSSELKIGDEILIRSGMKIPVDGDIVEGEALIDTAALTGESVPEARGVGDKLRAGTSLTEGFIRMRVTAAESDSWPARLSALIEKAKRSKAPIEKMADRISIFFTWFSVAAAATAFVFGLFFSGWESAILRALAVLVISCPCALGVATPLAFWKTFERITRRGIFFKDLARLEMLAKIRGVFFDKTGTLTLGSLSLNSTELETAGNESEALKITASLAQASAHPLSKALVSEAKKRNIDLDWPQDVVTKTGEGITGSISGIGKVSLGNVRYLDLQHRKINAPHLIAAWNGEPRVLFTFKEDLRPGADEVLKVLAGMRLEVGVLTGSREQGVFAEMMNPSVKIVSGLSPDAKMNWVSAWEYHGGPALVVGEGLNDALMTGRASVSLVLGSGADETRASADFVLSDDDLRKIPWLIREAKSAINRVKINLFWALAYNALAIPLAVLGLVNPIIAGAAMVLSSVFVISNSVKNGERNSI